MAEALSIASPLAATPLPVTTPSDAPSVAAGDPFAAMFNSLTAPAALPPAQPVAAALPMSDLPAIAGLRDEDVPAEAGASPDVDDGDAAPDATPAPAGDPMAAAIDAGLTAVLALAVPNPSAPKAVDARATAATTAPLAARAAARVATAATGSDLSPAPSSLLAQAEPAPIPAAAPAAADGTGSTARGLDTAARREEADAATSGVHAQDAAEPVDAAPVAVRTAPIRATLPATAGAVRMPFAEIVPGKTADTTSVDSATQAGPAAPANAAAPASAPGPDREPARTPPQGQVRTAAIRTVPVRQARIAAFRHAVDGMTPAITTQVAPATLASASPGAAAPATDTIVQQHLAIADDGRWLDSLARDIVQSADAGRDLHFRLDPQQLGSLTVNIAQSADGAAIRMTTDSDATRTILIDAQPKLVAEARAQGLRISETQVDLGNAGGGAGQSPWQQAGNPNGQDGRAASPIPQPLQAIEPDEAPIAASARDERYA